jgi:hypothetical protein
MKRTATCFAAALALTAPAALAESKTFSAQSFSQIEAAGPIDVVYEAAATPSIVVEQAENDFSDIYLDFEGDTLIVSRNSIRNRSGWFNNVSINTKNDRKVIKVNGKRVPYYVVRVSGPDLDGVLVKRSAKLTAKESTATTSTPAPPPAGNSNSQVRQEMPASKRRPAEIFSLPVSKRRRSTFNRHQAETSKQQ